jgi:hypothetical protein
VAVANKMARIACAIMAKIREEGRLRTITPARNTSAAWGLAEVEIFATLRVPGSWLPAKSNLGHSLCVCHVPATKLP